MWGWRPHQLSRCRGTCKIFARWTNLFPPSREDPSIDLGIVLALLDRPTIFGVEALFDGLRSCLAPGHAACSVPTFSKQVGVLPVWAKLLPGRSTIGIYSTVKYRGFLGQFHYSTSISRSDGNQFCPLGVKTHGNVLDRRQLGTCWDTSPQIDFEELKEPNDRNDGLWRPVGIWYAVGAEV